MFILKFDHKKKMDASLLDIFLDVMVIATKTSTEFDIGATTDVLIARQCAYAENCQAPCKLNSGRCVPGTTSHWFKNGISFINGPDGDPITLMKHWQIEVAPSLFRSISLLHAERVDSLRVLVFPVGSPRLFPDSLMREITKSITSGQHLLLCGHSMGAGFCVMFFVYLAGLEDFDISKIYVCATGGYPCLSSKQLKIFVENIGDRYFSLSLFAAHRVDPKIASIPVASVNPVRSVKEKMLFVPTIMVNIDDIDDLIIHEPDTHIQSFKQTKTSYNFTGKFSKSFTLGKKHANMKPDNALHAYAAVRSTLEKLRGYYT
jgi:hypothetical protein